MEKIKLVVFDIDGVITDGTVIVDSSGNESKRINLKDVDAIYELYRRGIKIAAITGEDTQIVDYFEKRFPWEYFYRGTKTKLEALKQIEKHSGVSRRNIAYIGDGKYDVEPLKYAGIGFCPANAADLAKEAADVVLHKNGGDGCVWKLIDFIDNKKPCDKKTRRERLVLVGMFFLGLLVFESIGRIYRYYLELCSLKPILSKFYAG